MRKIYSILLGAVAALSFAACAGSTPNVAEMNKGQNVQVFVADNTDGKITTKTIEEGFIAAGMKVDGNNNMNSPFSKRFKHIHYKVYNLAMFHDEELSFNLIKKYENFGALLPLTMSIWSDDTKHTMNISCLTLAGMSRATGIPATDPDLIAYAAKTRAALLKAMPNGHFKVLNFKFENAKASYEQKFTMPIELEEDQDLDGFKEDFEDEFEGELEPLGFLLPNYINLNEELFDGREIDTYDFYDTYSICKFDVIYPVSKLHPEAGAWAPCSFYVYKKKGENTMHMGYLGVQNWIKTIDINDKEAIDPLIDAQGKINDILKEMLE